MPTTIRFVVAGDYSRWLPLWDAYNEFYGRVGPTALRAEVTAVTWARFLDASEPMHALVCERDGALVGLAHYLFHRSTTMLAATCYLQNLFTEPALRGQGIASSLIDATYAQAKRAGTTRVYWQTHESNRVAMKLYDRSRSARGSSCTARICEPFRNRGYG